MRKEPKLLGTVNLLGVTASTSGAIVATVGVPVVVAVVAVAGGGEVGADAGADADADAEAGVADPAGFTGVVDSRGCFGSDRVGPKTGPKMSANFCLFMLCFC
jgi:hypothetical protein